MAGILYLIKSKGNRYKIGITKNLKQRARTIDRSIRGTRERVVLSVRLINMRYYERRLHRYFEKRNFKYTGSGKTEWFRLRPWEVIRVKVLMLRFWLEQALVIACFVLLTYKVLQWI